MEICQCSGVHAGYRMGTGKVLASLLNSFTPIPIQIDGTIVLPSDDLLPDALIALAKAQRYTRLLLIL